MKKSPKELLLLNEALFNKYITAGMNEKLMQVIFENEDVFTKTIKGAILLLKDVPSSSYIGYDENGYFILYKDNKYPLDVETGKNEANIKISISDFKNKIENKIKNHFTFVSSLRGYKEEIHSPDKSEKKVKKKSTFKPKNDKKKKEKNGSKKLKVHTYQYLYEMILNENDLSEVDLSNLSSNVELEAGLTMKNGGENYGLSKYSSISITSSIRFKTDIKENKEFTDFAYEFNMDAIRKVHNKLKEEFNSK